MKAQVKIGLYTLLISVSAFPIPMAVSAGAEDVPGGTIEEVVVTAQKRSEDAQKVPIAISALSARSLQLAHVESTTELGATVPGLLMGTSNGMESPRIRGVGNVSQAPGSTILSPRMSTGFTSFLRVERCRRCAMCSVSKF